MGIYVPLNVNHSAVGSVPTRQKPFLGSSFPVWGKHSLTGINPHFRQQTLIGSYPFEIYPPFSQQPPLGKQLPLGQQPPIGQQFPLGQ
jgi:hypothetical protein